MTGGSKKVNSSTPQYQTHSSGSSMDATFIWKLAKLGRVGSSHQRYDDDWVDRLNYQITCFLHFLFIGVLGLRSYIGKPIQCWAPQEFNKAWEEYSENFCWVSNTFYAPINNDLPLRMDRSSKMIGYYQWTPIVLACQALLFYLPCLLWRLLTRYSGFNVRRIIQMASDTNSIVPDINTKNIRFIARYIDTCIERNYYGHCRRNQISVDSNKKQHHHHQHHSNNCDGNSSGEGNSPSNGTGAAGGGGGGTTGTTATGNRGVTSKSTYHYSTKRCCHELCYASCNYRNRRCYVNNGRFLFFLYGVVKIIYIFNIIFQLYLMKRFLGTNSSFFGAKVLIDLVNGLEWNQSGNFPRVTFCEVQTKKLGENNIYNLQCVLPLNMFLEKIYIFLWFYYVVLGAITFTSLASWLTRMGRLRCRYRFVRKYLRVLNAVRETDNTASLKFTENHLRPDGVFLLHLVTLNVGHIAAGDLTVELWNIYRYKNWHDADNIRFLDMDYQRYQQHHHSSHQLPPFSQQKSARTAASGTAGSLSHTPSAMAMHHRYPPKMESALSNINTNNTNNNNNNNNSEKSNNHDDIV